ncbi:MAG: nitrilase family protein [Muribaculaceae bacterium]|nr:nitrilase family protein [Muribaculaceae bacterium]MEE1297839.1 nitrilase-related carbon-nitrogen hydrolase [Muribaculaceae bacterium]
MITNKKLNIAIIEDSIIWGNKNANLSKLEENLQYIPQETDIVILPELFSTGFLIEDPEQMRNLSERNTENTIYTLKRLAKQYNIAITGSFIACTANKIFNRAFFIENSGDEYYYDKRHLFSIGGEHEVFSHGNDLPPVIRYRGWNIMLAVCYDLRFPVWLKNTNNKYDALIVVANWPSSREYVWKHLLIARSIENISYVCGCNRIGKSPTGIEYTGASTILDFRGQPIEKRIQGTKILYATLNSDKLTSYRENFPAWKDFDDFELNI